MFENKLKDITQKKFICDVDFSKDGSYTFNAFATDKYLSACGGFEKSQINIENGVKGIRCYGTDEYHLLYANDKNIYRGINSNYSIASMSTFPTTPQVINYFERGEPRNLVVCGYVGEILGFQPLNFSTCVYNNCSIIENRIFFCDKNSVFFSEDITTLDYSQTIDFTLLVDIPKSLGLAKKVFAIDDNLYIIAKNGICKVFNWKHPSLFKLSVLNTPYLDVVNDSPVKIGEQICFVSENKIYTLLHDNLQEHNVFDKNIKVTQINSCGKFKHFYLVPQVVDCENRKALLVFNTLSKESYYFSGIDNISTTNGYSFDKNDNSIMHFTNDINANQQVVWKSNSINFGTCKRKSLNIIEICLEDHAILSVTGDFGVRTFHLTSGCNCIKTNLLSKSFTFTFNGSTACLPICNLRLTYNIKGE